MATAKGRVALAAAVASASGCLGIYGEISDLEEQTAIHESGRPNDIASQDYPLGIAFGGSGGDGVKMTVIGRSPAGVANLRFSPEGELSSSGVQLGDSFGDLNAGAAVLAGFPPRFDGDDSVIVGAPLSAGGGRIVLFDADSSQNEADRLTTGEVPESVAVGETDAVGISGVGPDIASVGSRELSLFINFPEGEDKRSCALPDDVVSVAILDIEQSPGDEIAIATRDGAIRVVTGGTVDAANAGDCFAFGQLYTVTAPGGETDFGAEMIAADLDGSGELDLVVTAPESGQVFVYLDLSSDVRDGSDPLLNDPLVLSGAGGFGAAVAAGDLDEDGTAELAVGAPRTEVDGSAEAGEVQVFGFSGGEAALRVRLQRAGASAGDLFGRTIAVAGFADADELLVVGSRDKVFVYFRHPLGSDTDPRLR
jgi:hypothetical protein